MITIIVDPTYVFYRGATFTVEWYFNQHGIMEAREYYERLPAVEQDRLHHIVAYIADNPIGTRLPKSLYNLEDADQKIYAFKPRDHRFFNFMTFGRKIVICNAYRKHSQRMSLKDLSLVNAAINSKNNYAQRVREGAYYERFTEPKA